MRPYDLLIFDWDGTLSDSAQLIANSMQAAIRGLNLPARSDQQIRELIGLGLADAMAQLYPELPRGQVMSMLGQYRSHWLSKQGGGLNEAPLFAGAADTLAALYQQGYVLAIATGKSRAGLDRSLAHHRPIKPLFLATRTADETANKPSPLMVNELLAETGISAARALMIGDTSYDAEMAKAARVAMLGLACGVHEAGRIQGVGALAVLGTVAELPGWLGA